MLSMLRECSFLFPKTISQVNVSEYCGQFKNSLAQYQLAVAKVQNYVRSGVVRPVKAAITLTWMSSGVSVSPTSNSAILNIRGDTQWVILWYYWDCGCGG